MKIKTISILAIFILLIAGISCKRNVSPFIPEIDTANQTGKARLVGNIVLAGSNIKDFGLINIGIRGTNLRAHPDKNGNFRVDNLPLGDILVDVDVRNTLSYIPINNVTSNDEISLEIEVQGNDKTFFYEGRKNKNSKKELQVTIQPDEWDTSWVDSDKYVTAKISGKGFDDIVAESVQMVGPGGTAIAPASSEVRKKSLEAKFLRSAAIGIISNPVAGQSYVINITGEFNDETVLTLTDSIVIEEEEEDKNELELGIKPDEWDTSWVVSDEYVTAKISGKGFDTVDVTTVQMVGPGGTAIAPASSESGDKSLEAKFLRSAAIGLITDPVAGQSYEIKATGSLSDGITFSLTDIITIVEESDELELAVKPDEWDTSWVVSDEYVTAKISGKGFDTVDVTTVQMVGPGGTAIIPESTELGDRSLEIKFLRSAAIGLISNPVVDQSYEIQVTGELSGGTAFTLADTITIVEELELDLGIKPDEWKTSWVNSTGDVTAKISGKGFDRIEAATVQMVGPGGTAITPESTELGDKSLEAKFLQSAAIGLISNPAAGQSYEIQVTGELNDGTVFTLTDTITIEEEDDDEEEEEEGELELTIDPEKWNTNWEDSKGLVTARIKGKGFKEIDGDSVLMVGPDGDVITPYSYKVTGNSFMAKFRKQDAMGTITDPEPGEEYVIQVTGTLGAGSQFSLEYEIKIVGSKK